MSSNIFQVLILTQKAEVKIGKINIGKDTELNLHHIQTHFKKKVEPELLGTYNYKTYTLFLIGFSNGKAGSENKHEFPPPHDSMLVFGDIMLIASKSDISFASPVPFKVEDYELFYSRAFGGFDDLDEEEDEDENENENENEIDEFVEDAEALEEENEEVIEKSSYASYEDIEEEIIVVKKKKKGLNANSQIINNLVIHPDLQLQFNSEKNDLRMKTIEKMKIILTTNLSSSEIEHLEQEIYNASLKESEIKHIIKDWSNKQFEQIYLTCVRKIVGNLHEHSYVQNKELLKKYKANEISFETICSMNYYDLYYSKWNDHITHQQNIEKRQIEGNKSMATDQFLCTRCYKRECTYYEMQTRSADEPMTIFINCLNCGKNWRQ